MNKLFSLIACLIITLFINSATAQDNLRTAEAQSTKRDTKIVNIVSLDGKATKVKIIPDYVNRMLRMTCLKDTINIIDFWGVPPEIHLLNKSFIEIKYEVRGGSNLGLGNTLILCVSGGKLYEAIHVLRYINWDSRDVKSDYHIKLALNGNSKSNYRLTVRIHDSAYSRRNPETNYTYNNQTFLSFDKKLHVFYSIREDVYNHFISTKQGKLVKQKIGGNFPTIILGKETYYFINNRWYQLGRTNELDEIE